MSNFINSNTTNYNNFITNFYFKTIIKQIIEIGKLRNTEKKILDYGCGNKMLAKSLMEKKIFNYDIKPEYSDFDDYKNLKFDIIIINHVLEYFDKSEIIKFLEELKKINPECELIIGLTIRGFVSKLFKNLLLQFTAHDNFILNYKDILKILNEYTENISKPRNIFLATKILHLKFK